MFDPTLMHLSDTIYYQAVTGNYLWFSQHSNVRGSVLKIQNLLVSKGCKFTPKHIQLSERPSGVINLACWLPKKPDTRITIPHPSLTLKPLIPYYTKQKQPSLASAPKSQGIRKKKYFTKYLVKGPTACSNFAVL